MKKVMAIVCMAFSLMGLIVLQGCMQDDLKKSDLKTEYQAVLLIGGIGYFGKIDKIGQSYIEMTDVYYVQSRQNPETNQVNNILIKRGKELHGPDRMFINKSQVIMIEPVAPDSKLAQSIKEINAKGGQ